MLYRNNLNNNNQGPITIRDNRNVNIEISYDNFDTVNLDQSRRKQYAYDLRRQIEENELKRRLALEKKRKDDLEEELRLQRERELIEKREKEEADRIKAKIRTQRYEPQQIKVINKTIRKKTPVSYQAPIQTNDRYEINNNYINENILNYLKSRELQIEDFNKRILDQMQLLNSDFENNINCLRSQIGALTNMHNKNQKYKDQLNKEVHQIKENLDIKKIQDTKNSKNINELVAMTDFTRGMVEQNNYIEPLPKCRFDIRSYGHKGRDYEDDYFEKKISDSKKEELKLPYINLSHCVSYSAPKWKPNENIWWYN